MINILLSLQQQTIPHLFLKVYSSNAIKVNKKSIAKGQNYPYTMLFTILYLFVLLSNKPTAIPYLPHFNRIAFVNSIILPKHKSTNFQKYSLSKNFTITFIFTNFIFSKHRNNLHKFQEYL